MAGTIFDKIKEYRFSIGVVLPAVSSVIPKPGHDLDNRYYLLESRYTVTASSNFRKD